MHLALPVWFEIGSMVVLVLILAADLLLVLQRPHVPIAEGVRACGWASTSGLPWSSPCSCS